MKKLYPLRPKIGTQSDFFVFDTETGQRTKQGKNTLIEWQLIARPEKFIFGVIYGLNYTKVFHSREEMILEFKTERFKKKKVFAHNFGKFDGSVMFDNIFDLDPEAIFIGSRFISATNGNCTFGDSTNIYKASVKEIGKKLGLEKLGMNDGNYLQSLWPQDESRDINGCIRDCQIVWDALFEIFQECSAIKLTIGSLSMEYYRRFHQEYIIESNDFVKNFWSSYYGGRTEALKLGNTHSQVIDVNSLYPWCMKTATFPNPKFLKYEKTKDVKHFLFNILPYYEGCSNITVNHPSLFIGLLPYRADNKLTFPVGTFSGCWNFNEIRFALEHGVKIIEIKDFTYAEKMESPFINFVDVLSREKFLANETGRGLDEWKYKYLMNNLYGKFAQRIEEKSIYIKDIVSQYDVIEFHQRQKTFIKLVAFNSERSDCFLIVKDSRKIEISYSIPSFSSYITSLGRITLAKKLLEMERNLPVYCDTDSIFFEINDNVQTSHILGEWKLEDKIVTKIRGLKNYVYISNQKEYSRIKGVPGKAKEVAKNTYKFSSLVGTKEALIRNLEVGLPMERTKVITGKYDKRKVLKNGLTEPITI